MKFSAGFIYMFQAMWVSALIFFPYHVGAEQTSTSELSSGLVLERAVMCEAIESFEPKNPAVVFSISIGKIMCFTSFNMVPEEMVIYHKWYRKDQLSTKRKLTLKPPKWSTFSEILLREADNGPWRVEVTDVDGNIIRILRFSITD